MKIPNTSASSGFTLIEVLVALAILSIALTAIIKATAQNVKDSVYLQNKAIANWVGTEIVNEMRAGIIKPPLQPDTLDVKTNILGQNWVSKAYYIQSPNPHIRELHVDIFPRMNSKKMMQLTSYMYAPTQN